jgi:hypothetical protein
MRKKIAIALRNIYRSRQFDIAQDCCLNHHAVSRA